MFVKLEFFTMKLIAWRNAKKLSQSTVAERLGLDGLPGSLRLSRIERGEVKCDADLVEVIENITDGEVTPRDMNDIRLVWLRENQPERFGEEATT